MRSFFCARFFTPGSRPGILGLAFHVRYFMPDISCPGYTVRLSFKKVRLISPSRAAPDPEYVRVNVVAWGAARISVAEPQALEPLAVVAK